MHITNEAYNNGCEHTCLINETNCQEIETREVDHFWYTCWPSVGVPEPISLVKLVLDIRPRYHEGGTPLVVHCRWVVKVVYRLCLPVCPLVCLCVLWSVCVSYGLPVHPLVCLCVPWSVGIIWETAGQPSLDVNFPSVSLCSPNSSVSSPCASPQVNISCVAVVIMSSALLWDCPRPLCLFDKQQMKK